MLFSFISGKSLVQRACSKKLEISLRKTTVCIEESRPSEGMLCFCDKDKCNMAPQLHRYYSWINSVILALLCLHLTLVNTRWGNWM